MKRLIALVLLVAGTGLSIYAQHKHSVTQAQARLIESEFSVLTAPVIGELDQISSKKITHKVEFPIGMFKDAQKEIVPNLEDYKKYTIANYCTINDYDLVINPLFQVSTTANGDKLIVTVTGYPARYKNFRPAKAEDSWMLDFIDDYSADDRVKRTMNSNQ